MVEKFNPAPLDKHPGRSQEAAKADRDMDGNFMADLVGTFPASDPVSAVIMIAEKASEIISEDAR
jgi:hypothetical protein